MALSYHALQHLGPFDNNSYLLVDDATRQAAVMDVGFEAGAMLDLIRKEKVTVSLLLLTHAHYDHACGMLEVQGRHPVPCWMHPADAPLLAALSRQGEMFGLPEVEPPGDVRDLADGQVLELGESRFEVIHTPGHSPGGVCFRSGDDLWVGDTLFAGSIGRTDLPGGSFADLERAIRSRLFPLGDALRCHPGHGQDTTLGVERRTNPFVGDGATLS